jgi:Protein of unknown function (DUF2842)
MVKDGGTMRARSLIATSAIVGGLVVYALAVMLAAELLPPYWPVQTGFFAVVGLVWVVPAACFVRWGVGGRNGVSASRPASAESGRRRSDSSP